MKKWTGRIETQRRLCHEQARLQRPETDNSTFSYMRNQNLVNPYTDQEEDPMEHPGYAESASSTGWSRNASSSSIQSRQRSGTGESYNRGARPVLPPGSINKGLTVHTQRVDGMTSPSESVHKGASYFSPGAESPSSRASTASSILGFPRQPVHSPWHGNDQRYTAPARDHQGYSYDIYGRGLSGKHGAELAAIRNRSLSTSSDMHRRTQQNAPPVPSVPQNFLGGGPSQVNRSQSNSPMSPDMYGKPPGRYQPGQYHDGSSFGRNPSDDAFHQPPPDLAPLSIQTSGIMSPPLGSASTLGPIQPSQLKIKVKVPTEGSTMMLVVSNNISYESLKDRIDAKLQRITNVSLSSGSVKLKYLYDDEYISIQTDEDVQTAFETWREEQQEAGNPQFGDIELFCHPVNR